MAEQRYNNQSGFLGTALDPSTPGTSQAVTGLFSVAPDFAALSDGDSIKLALDAGADTFEIVYLTAYDPASPLDGTITRAAEDATNWPAVGHQAGTGTWTCAPTVDDFTSGGGAVSSVFGRTGDVVAASGDYTAAEVGAAPTDAGVPSGGTTNQVLAKSSNTDYDTGWVDQSSGSGSVSSVNDIDPDGSGNVTLTASDVGAAPATSGTAILKGDGSGGTASATAGTDYLAPSGSGAALTGITPSQVGAAATADNLSDLASASDAAHNLGLGTADTPTFSGLILSTAGGTGRLMGWTASGAPSTGTWTTGDTVLDNTGMVWTCTAGGTPGTWVSLTSSAQAESDRRSDTLNQLAEPTAAVLFGGQQAKNGAKGTASTDFATLQNSLSDLGGTPSAAIPLGGQKLTGGAAATAPDGVPIASQIGQGVYGDGSDGALNFDGTSTVLGIAPTAKFYTLNRDIFATNMTVATGVVICTNGYRVFCSGTLTGPGVIIPGTALGGVATGSIPGGSAGAVATTGAGVAASNVTNAYGGAGGAGGAGTSGAGGAAGTVTAPSAASGTIRALPWAQMGALMGPEVALTPIVPGSGGGSGAGDGTNKGGNGGHSGGLVIVVAKYFSTTNVIGLGAVGGGGANASAGNAGGGGGGGGGVIIVISMNPTVPTTTVSGGTAGTGVGTGSAGTAGSAGVVIPITC